MQNYWVHIQALFPTSHCERSFNCLDLNSLVCKRGSHSLLLGAANLENVMVITELVSGTSFF